MDLQNYGFILMRLKRYEESRNYLEQAADYFANLPAYEYAYESALNHLGGLYYNMGDSRKAFENYLICLKMAERTDNTYKKARTMANIANVMLLDNDLDKAMNIYQIVLEIARALGRKQLEANILSKMESILTRLAGYKTAVEKRGAGQSDLFKYRGQGYGMQEPHRLCRNTFP